MSTVKDRIKALAKKKHKPKITLYYMKHSEITILRNILLKKQKGVCSICKLPVEAKDAVLDHQHKKNKHQRLGDNGAGLVRRVLHSWCNTWEGSVQKMFFRRGMSNKGVDLNIALKGLAEVYETGHYVETTKDGERKAFVHPTEVPKIKTLPKRPFAKIAKMYSEEFPKRKRLVYPRSKKPTKQILELSVRYGVSLYN